MKRVNHYNRQHAFLVRMSKHWEISIAELIRRAIDTYEQEAEILGTAPQVKRRHSRKSSANR